MKLEGSDRMKKLRSTILWAGLVLILLLTIFSIYGAFIGADRAQEFFNSMPLAAYWVILALVLGFGLMSFRRLIRVPGLLLMHIGCVCIIAGGMWGSDQGHELQNKYLNKDKIPSGRMIIYEGQTQNEVHLDVKQESENEPPVMEKLPFAIKLTDFRMTHYQPTYLYATAKTGETWKIPVEIGSEYDLGPEFGSVTVNKKFNNFKMTMEEGKTTFVDSTASGHNPALEIKVKNPQGVESSQYIFELHPGHPSPNIPLHFSWYRQVSDYISDLEVIDDEKIVKTKSIEVNHPLYYGGYHFYQSSYDSEGGRYTVLSVTSDSGLGVAFGGFFFICAGIIIHLWIKPIIAALKSSRQGVTNGN